MTLPPLLIAAENGDVLFYSGVRRRDACFAAIRTACAAQPRGILKIGDTRAYAKPVTLGGRTYYFFMDFDRLCACYGVEAAPRAAEGLFDVSTFSKAYAAPRTLGALTRLFADCYADALEDAGVRFYTRDLPRDVVVNVPPNAYALCLALLIRLAAVGGNAVTVSFVYTGGNVHIFADAKGGKPCPAGEAAFLRVLLAEVSAAAGFAMEETPQGITLSLCPLDGALLGCKAELTRTIARASACLSNSSDELLKEFPCAAKSVQFRALHVVFCRRGEKSSSGGARAASAAAAWAKARTGNAAPPALSTVLLYHGKKAQACCCAFFSIYHSIQAFPGGEGVAERRRMRGCIQLA